MKIAPRIAMLAAVAGFIVAPALAAESGYTWFTGDDGPENASLVYGNPESAEDIVLALNCGRGSGTVNVFIAETSEKFKPGQKVTIVLSIGSVKVSLQGETLANEMTGIPSVQTTVPSADPLFQAMKDPETLSLDVDTWNRKVSLKGIGAKATEFAAACTK